MIIIINVIIPNKEYEIVNVGKINILNYAAIYEKSDKSTIFGADMIFMFNALDSFGKGGNTVTFVQIVADDFSYITPEKEKKYTWSKNKNQDFKCRNYKEDGSTCGDINIPLNYSIDQYVSSTNFDYRYPEDRKNETTSLSNQDKKVNLLIEKIKNKEISLEEYNLEELKEPQYNTDEKKKAEIIKRLNCDDNIVPYVVYSAVKSVGKWQPGRMSDSPRTYALNIDTYIQGSQKFETLLMFYDNASKSYFPLCTVSWGWSVDVSSGKTKLMDIRCVDGLPQHWQKAREQWNKYEVNGFKIPDIK